MVLTPIVVNDEFRDEMSKYFEKPSGKGLLQACSENVVLFSKYMLGITLYSWQVYFLSSIMRAVNDDFWTKEFVAITSRQIGKSTSLAILALWSVVFNKRPTNDEAHNSVVGIISASDSQAKELLRTVRTLIRIGDRFMFERYDGRFGKNFFSSLIDDNEPNNTTHITFKAGDPEVHGDYLLVGSRVGSVIKSFPPTQIVLGETFTMLFIDEAGRSDKITDQVFYDFIHPTGDAHDAIRVYTSTPWTLNGFFYEMVDPDELLSEHPYERVVFTIDAIKDDNPKQYETVMKKIENLVSNGKTDEVQRAYYCRFVKGDLSYFDPDKVRNVFDDSMSLLESFSGECDLGVDFGGQTTSRTVITISALDDNGVIRRLYHRVYEVGKDDSLLDDIADLLERFNVQRIIPDDCPQGDYLIRMMRDKGWNVHPMNFRSEKVKKFGAFRAMVNKGLVKSYVDEDLKVEMMALEFSNSSRQSVIRHAPGYNDDMIDSFVLSSYFFLQDESGFRYYDLVASRSALFVGGGRVPFGRNRKRW